MADEEVKITEEAESEEAKRHKNSKILRAVGIGLIILIVAGVVGRIIYVNCKSPSTKITMVEQGQNFTGHVYDISVNDAVVYSKEQWIALLETNAEDGVDYKLYNNIPWAGDEYDVVYVDISITNKSQEKVSITKVRSNLVLMSGYRPVGFSTFFKAKEADSEGGPTDEIEAGKTKGFVCVFIRKEGYEQDCMLQYCELGKNQRMKIQPREIQ